MRKRKMGSDFDTWLKRRLEQFCMIQQAFLQHLELSLVAVVLLVRGWVKQTGAGFHSRHKPWTGLVSEV